MKVIRLELLDRTKSIVGYLRLLRFAEVSGTSIVTGTGSRVFVTSTLHVLKAGVFVHLYNLVESTVDQVLAHVASSIEASRLPFDRLNPIWRRVWGKHAGVDLENGDRRMKAVLQLCEDVAKGAPARFAIPLPSGNLDDRKIEDLFKRLGIRLHLRPTVLARIKRQILNDQGFLGLIRVRRNELAHGAHSFSDVGSQYSVQDLVQWTWATNQYLRDVVTSVEAFVAKREFENAPTSTPSAQASASVSGHGS
jgi:hypothetical protein